MYDALDLFSEEQARDPRDAGARSSARSMTRVKRNEYKEFLQVISPWEREHLLLNV
jgi:glutamine synthetase